MITRSEKVRLGIFLLTSGALLVVTIGLLTGLNLTKSEDSYTVRFKESVSGLEIGAQVKYNGVRVGQITDVQIDPQNLDLVLATLALREGTPIKTDTKAVLVAMGITGLKFVELTDGSQKAALIKPGSEIEAGQSFIGTLEGKAQDIAVKTEITLNRINTMLSEKNLEAVSHVIENVDDVTSGFTRFLERNDEKFDRVVTGLDTASKQLNVTIDSANVSAKKLEGIMTDATPKVAKILNNVDETTNSFKQAAKSLSRVDDILKEISGTLIKFNNQIKDVDVKKITGDAQVAVEEAKDMLRSLRKLVEASRGDVYQSAKSLNRTMRNLEELSGALRDQPSLIINSKAPEERTAREK